MKIKLLTALVGSALLAGCNSSSSSDAPEVSVNTPITYTTTSSMSLNREKTCGIPNLDVFLHDANGNHVDTLVTDENGSITLGDIPAGHYFTAVPTRAVNELISYQKELVRMPTTIEVDGFVTAGDSCVISDIENDSFYVRIRKPDSVEFAMGNDHIRFAGDDSFFEDVVVYEVRSDIPGILLELSYDKEDRSTGWGPGTDLDSTLSFAKFVTIEELKSLSDNNEILSINESDVDMPLDTVIALNAYSSAPVDMDDWDSFVGVDYLIDGVAYDFFYERAKPEAVIDIANFPSIEGQSFVAYSQNAEHEELGFTHRSRTVVEGGNTALATMDADAYLKVGHPTQPENFTFEFNGFNPDLQFVWTSWEDGVSHAIYSTNVDSVTIPNFYNLGSISEYQYIRFYEYDSAHSKLAGYLFHFEPASTASQSDVNAIVALENANNREIIDNDLTPGIQNPVCHDDEDAIYHPNFCVSPEHPIELQPEHLPE
ncbi:hypothetical protein [Vibrio agarivorans]|uniref:Prealbumin-like fold domain-containing protein n=1 Tax=Vibrio agarivorans TaxID=153622 RepID=A0ABT7XZV7_9VIBR|nr:hypothetical protein [Vibrio agarivorans]MDN2481323.1 hypothetical protein [Vibrio agarivorans]